MFCICTIIAGRLQTQMRVYICYLMQLLVIYIHCQFREESTLHKIVRKGVFMYEFSTLYFFSIRCSETQTISFSNNWPIFRDTTQTGKDGKGHQ